MNEVLSGEYKFGSGSVLPEHSGKRHIGAKKLSVQTSEAIGNLYETGNLGELGGVLGEGYKWWMRHDFQSFTSCGRATKMESPISAEDRQTFNSAEASIEEFLFHSKCHTLPRPRPALLCRFE